MSLKQKSNLSQHTDKHKDIYTDRWTDILTERRAMDTVIRCGLAIILRFYQVQCTFSNIPTCVYLPVGGKYPVFGVNP